MGFLEDLIEMTKESEAPRSYWLWSGLSAISACSKNLWLDRHYYKLYPNIYVLLVGKSANRKGPPINLAQDLVEDAMCTRVISGSNSIQVIIERVSRAKHFPNGNILQDGSAFLVSDEQSNLLLDDKQAHTILTQLYDTGYHKTFEKETIKGGLIQIKNPYFVSLGGTAPAHIPEYIQQRSVTGGFIGRTMVINEERRERLNSLMQPPKVRVDREKLIEQLKKIASLKGEFTMSEQAKETYDAWYYPYNKSLEDGEITDETGTAGRLGDHVLKIAMLLSLSYSDTLAIDSETVEVAIDTCVSFSSSVRKIGLLANNQSEFGLGFGMVLDFLVTEGGSCTRKKILQRKHGTIDFMELDRIQETMIQGDFITVEKNEKGEALLKLKPDKYEYFATKRNERLKRKTSGKN